MCSFRSSCCAHSVAMLLLSPASISRTAAASKALRAARSQRHSENIKIPSFLCPLFLCPILPECLQCSPCSKQRRTHTHTQNFNLLSAARVIITQCHRERERDREGGKIKGKKELKEKLQADQRCKNASVYLLLAGKGCHDEDRTKHTWTTYGDTHNDIKRGKKNIITPIKNYNTYLWFKPKSKQNQADCR